MDEATAKYFEELDEVFSTKGWQRILEELKSEIYNLQADALELDTWEQVVFAKGQAQAYNRLIRLEEIADVTRANLLADAADEDNANI